MSLKKALGNTTFISTFLVVFVTANLLVVNSTRLETRPVWYHEDKLEEQMGLGEAIRRVGSMNEAVLEGTIVKMQTKDKFTVHQKPSPYMYPSKVVVMSEANQTFPTDYRCKSYESKLLDLFESGHYKRELASSRASHR